MTLRKMHPSDFQPFWKFFTIGLLIFTIMNRMPGMRYIPAIISWQYGSKIAPPATIVGNDLAMLEIILSISSKCMHNRTGVKRYNLNYDLDEFAFHRMRYPDSGKQYVMVKLNPRDISYVYVFITEADKYIRVPCVDPDGYTKGLSARASDYRASTQEVHWLESEYS